MLSLYLYMLFPFFAQAQPCKVGLEAVCVTTGREACGLIAAVCTHWPACPLSSLLCFYKLIPQLKITHVLYIIHRMSPMANFVAAISPPFHRVTGKSPTFDSGGLFGRYSPSLSQLRGL